MKTGQYNMLSTPGELHPCNQRKGIECKLVLLTNRTLLCEHHHVGIQMTPNADCSDNGTRQRESILSECLDFLHGICKIIIAMESVRFCLVQVTLCTKLWQAFRLKILFPQQQRHI
jgi:hypothetical protein